MSNEQKRLLNNEQDLNRSRQYQTIKNDYSNDIEKQNVQNIRNENSDNNNHNSSQVLSKYNWMEKVSYLLTLIILVFFYVYTRPSNFKDEKQCQNLRKYSEWFLVYNTIFLILSVITAFLGTNNTLRFLCLKYSISCVYLITWLIFFILLNIAYNSKEECRGLGTVVYIYLMFYYIGFGFLFTVLLCLCLYKVILH